MYKQRYQRAAKRRSEQGQSFVISSLLSLTLTAAVLLYIANFRANEIKLQNNLIAADEMTYVANASAKYIDANYTAFEQWFNSAGVNSIEGNASCSQGGSCTFPFLGTPVGTAYGKTKWESLAQAGYLVPEQTATNRYHQTYVLVVRCAITGATGCTQLSAMLAAYGGPKLDDSQNAEISDRIGTDAGYIPINPKITTYHTTPAWLTAWSTWAVAGVAYATQGHVAVLLDDQISTSITGGPIQRFSGGADTRPQTMNRTMYFGSNSNTTLPANVCFCGPTGYYAGNCIAPGSAAIPNTPASPNYCGIPAN